MSKPKILIKLKTPIPPVCDIKKCTQCNSEKPLIDYYAHGGKCKECVKANQRERNERSSKKEKEIMKDPNLRSQKKFCSGCGQDKTVGDFRINRGECLDCERKYGREYNRDNHDVRQTWWENNLDRAHKLQADWYQRNKEHVRAKFTSRYDEDKCFRIHHSLKRRLQLSISKISSTTDYIGTSFEQVANWLEYNFIDGMSWDNHGTVWDIDHVIPIARWDLNNQQHIDLCFDWKNLSPLNSGINRHEKSDKLDHAQIIRHKTMLKKYFEENQLDDEELTTYLVEYDQQLISLGETP
jgi:hypothetical protein